jgi:hypothetical protein
MYLKKSTVIIISARLLQIAWQQVWTSDCLYYFQESFFSDYPEETRVSLY